MEGTIKAPQPVQINPTDTAKAEKEKLAAAPYTYKRNVAIKPIETLSAYRQHNISVMGKRVSNIGSSISSTNILCSNSKEIAVLFPNIIGLDSNNPNFYFKVKDYLSNIQVVVADKVTFNNSLDFYHTSDYEKFKAEEDKINNTYENTDKREIKDLKSAIKTRVDAINALESKYIGDKLCFPVNVSDYILYRHCLLYNSVAKDVSLAGGDKNVRFYFVDEQREKNKRDKLAQFIREAKTNYIALMGDDDKFNAVFIRFCADNHFNILEYTSKDRTDKELLLDDFSRENPVKFNSFCKDMNLMMIAFIEKLIARGELVKAEHNQQLSLSDGTYIGKNMNDAVAYFNNPENKGLKDSLESKLKAFNY